VQIFFVSLPVWFIAATLYIGLSFVYQRKVRPALEPAKPGPSVAQA